MTSTQNEERESQDWTQQVGDLELTLQHIRSPELSEQGDISAQDDILLLDNLVSEDAPLLLNPNNRGYFGNFRIDVLVIVAYQYLRMLLGVLLLAYCIMMIFNGDKKTDVYYSKRRNVQATLPLYSSKDVRVVICVILIIIFGPSKLSVLFNLFHRKTVTQLKFTLIFCIVFILNCSEDEFNYSGVSFLTREKQDRFARLFGDMFYGISIQRSDKVILNICYSIFDLVIYPNIFFFLFMVFMFIIVVLLISFVTLTNFIGLTNYDLEDHNRQGPRRNAGLSRQELSRLVTTTYNALPSEHKHIRGKILNAKESADDLNLSNGSDSGISCSICYIPFTGDNSVVSLPKCEHLYHSECILSWFKTRTTCPICRLDMRDHLKPEEGGFDIFDKLNHSMLRMNFD